MEKAMLKNPGHAGVAHPFRLGHSLCQVDPLGEVHEDELPEAAPCCLVDFACLDQILGQHVEGVGDVAQLAPFRLGPGFDLDQPPFTNPGLLGKGGPRKPLFFPQPLDGQPERSERSAILSGGAAPIH